ncbi:cyclin-D1-1-like [Mercurialis annua]|uniref:cyclin-D1-1-like n=1 Tax=Mercurialis annua TaxID=3986 RepID=UPI00215EFDCE|nr:cyclin-D1-1-like [Mercurialis annua]
MSHSSASSAVNNLFCEEDAGELVQSQLDTWISSRPLHPLDEHTFDYLIDSEPQFSPPSDYLLRYHRRSIDVTARQDSINWILKVRAYYHFSPVTVLLSVNYFDRFLSSHSFPGNGWPLQLLTVACLSLAAKMEEIHVPLLIDFQILEPGFVFEPKTIQRMELHIMSMLNWKLRSVTPFDYLDIFISKLKPDDFNRVFSVSSNLILNTTRVIDFLAFPPSTISAAAVLCATGAEESFEKPQPFPEKIDKEMLRSCHQLMQEYLIDTCPSSQDLTAEPLVAPPSPVGVLDAAACGSCDTRSSFVSQAEAEPLAKRPRFSTPDVQQL